MGQESDEYGIGTYVYRTLSRFNEEKLIELFRKGFPSNKTIENTDTAFIWNQTGKFITFDAIGRFNDQSYI